jgi:Bacterial Ig domain
MKTTETICRIVISLLIGIVGSRSAEAICFVNGAATGANTGSSWSDAYTNPQFALINPGCTEIWVAKGVYKPTLGTIQDVSFVIPSGVEIYGGFAGGETNRDARLPAVNLTVLSGDIDNNDANAASTGVDESPADVVGNNSYHVIFINGGVGAVPVTSATVVDGFTITGGHANSTGILANGAGLYCDGHGSGRDDSDVDCSPLLRNLVFSGNAADGDGGAIYNNGQVTGRSSPMLIDVTLHQNSAGNNGGAICNIATDGGISSPTLTDVFFNANTAKLGGGMYSRSESLASEASDSSPTLRSVVFAGNSANTGGGMYAYAFSGGHTNPTLNVVTFNENRTNSASVSPAPYGGGLFVLAEGRSSVSRPNLLNVTFNENQSTYGGAIFDGSLTGGDIGLALMNVTIAGNIAEVGGGLYNGGDGDADSVLLTNVILWGDSATVDSASSEFKSVGTAMSVSYSVVAGNCPSDPMIVCSNIFTTSPLLGPLRENGGYTRTMEPAYGSSAIDTGTDVSCPNVDQRGLARPQGAHCEIGAVEVVPPPPPPPVALRESILMYRNTTKQITLVGNDMNPGGPYTFTYAQATPVSHGNVTLANEIATYTPAHDYIGLDSFTYTVTDVNGTSLPATVSINVLATPEAQPFEFTIPMNTTKSITLAASDATPAGAFTYATVDLPMHGSVTLVGDLATYTPATGYSGPDSYTYTATDGNGTSPPATVTIHVLPAKVPPVALPRAIVVPYNTSGTITFGATDSNMGGPFVYSFAKASLTTHGTLGVVESTHVVYVPTHNYSGPDSFTYTVTDVNGTSVPATVTITVLPAGGMLPGGTSAVPAVNALGLMLLSGLVGVFGIVRRLR